jgi:hypothetical protein
VNENHKLRILIPHWVEHNHEHAQEFLRFVEAAGHMDLVNRALAAALEKLGGALTLESDLQHHSRGSI